MKVTAGMAYQVSGFLFLLTVISAIGYAALRLSDWLTDVQKMPLTGIVLQGEPQYTSADEVRKIVLSVGAPTFFSVDVDALHQELAKLPWVYRVAVRKRWPNELHLTLIEQPVVGYWNQDSLVNEYGDVFAAPRERIEKPMMQFYGDAEFAKSALQTWRMVEPQLKQHQLVLSSLTVSPRQSWSLRINDDFDVLLGTEGVNERLERLFNLLPHLKDNAAYVDMRYDTGAAVGWKQPEPQRQDANHG